jgi:drug/metabolite transporter (DMT)-like permease
MVFILIIINLLWASTFIFGKVLLESFSVSFLISFRFILAAIVCGLIFRKKITLSKESVKNGIVIGGINGLSMLLQIIGLQYTTASNSGFITATYVLFLPFIEMALWKKKITAKVYSSVLIAFAGVILLSVTDFSAISFNKGDLFTLGCGFTFAFQIFFISHYTKDDNIYSIVFIQFIVSGLVGLGYMAFEAQAFGIFPNIAAALTPRLGGYLLFLGVFATFIPFSLQFYVQNKIGPTIAALAYLLEPVFTVILAVLILSEPFNIQTAIGIVLILSGIILVNLGNKTS